MTRAVWLPALVALAGCRAMWGTGDTVVRSVRVDGYDLVVERCQIYKNGGFTPDGELTLGACTTERQPLPATAPRSPTADLPETLDLAQFQAGLGPVRAAAVACGASHDFHGQLLVRVEISAAGAVIGADADVPAALADCVHAALGAARFPATQRGATFTQALDLP